MATEKILNTRILLKYDTFENWNASTFLLKKGELAIVEVPSVEGSTLQPVMFKVGTGDKKFSELDWASAKAADVYSWAKQAGITVEDNGTGSVVSDIEWKDNKLVITRIDVYTKTEADALFQPVGNYKTKQTVYNADGSTVKTITNVAQNENGEVTVTYSDILFPTINTGVMSVTGKDAISVTDGANPEVSLTIDPTSGNVVLTQSATGLKAEIDLSNYALNADIPTEDEIKAAAAAEINRLIEAADDEGGETIQNIANLVDYVEKNAGEIAQLITDVGTANTNASNAVTTAGEAKTTAEGAASVAGNAKTIAEQAKETAETAQNSAAASAAAAAGSAEAAAGSAGEALASKNAAADSAALAGEKAAAATNAATLAGEKAEAADGSAQAAAGSAETASTKAGEAADSALAASGSAQTASTKAGEASVSASQANTSANAAGEAQGKAEAAQAAAEKAKDDAEQAKADANTILGQVTDAATGAQTTANAAVTTANEAKATAGEAKTAAENAVSKADEAYALADAARTETEVNGQIDAKLDEFTTTNGGYDTEGKRVALYADKAIKDISGNKIHETYATKKEIIQTVTAKTTFDSQANTIPAGVKVETTGNKEDGNINVTIAIDDSLVWVFDCGSATTNIQ